MKINLGQARIERRPRYQFLKKVFALKGQRKALIKNQYQTWQQDSIALIRAKRHGTQHSLGRRSNRACPRLVPPAPSGQGLLQPARARSCERPTQLKVRRTDHSFVRIIWSVLILLCVPFAAIAEEVRPASSQSLIVVVGAGGNPQYEISFYQWSERWESAAKEAGIPITMIGRHRGEFKIEVNDYDRLRDAIRQAEGESANELWIVLIGHGTFDRRVAKFNLRGPDVSANELSEWLKPVRRPTAIINCSSASGPFIPVLSGPNRVVVTATKGGTEVNYTRFGDHLSHAINDPKADLDKDNQTSLWEAFLMASRRTAEYYDTDGRIATEHALLDDNGDGQGVRADQFQGLIAITKPTDGTSLDGRKAHQWHLVPNETEAKLPPDVRAKRNDLELAVEKLRDRKDDLPKDEYYSRLEKLLVCLAELNEQLEQSPAGTVKELDGTTHGVK